MTDDPPLHEDYHIEGLVRDYERQKDCGLAGLISRIDIYREAQKCLERERFDRFCGRVHVRGRIERNLMHHLVWRLEKLESILGSPEVASFCVFRPLTISRNEFESAIKLAADCSDLDAGSLFRDCVDDLASQVSRMKPGDPDKEIYGMTWTTEEPRL